MARKRRLSIIAAIAIAILAVAAIVPGTIEMGRHKARLAETLRIELGRDVTIGTVHLRVLPEPGFTIERFTIADDARFGAEPFLRAESVEADLRLTSLWHGRIEIAKISFENPSLNLVRNANGHWNLESLLIRASQIPSAPTPQAHAEARPRFPYIEATAGRINFKSGAVRSVYALTEADFSFWLESDNQWNARLEAKPFRTDMPITDTGLFKLQARLGRAPVLGEMPLEGRVTVEDAQLGQVSKLLFGSDEGWRGTLAAEFSARGRLDQLQVASKLRMTQFRRFDVAAGDTINLAADCSSKWVFEQGRRSLNGLACSAPIGDGTLAVHGDYSVGDRGAAYNLILQAHAVPADQLALIYRNARQNVAPDLQAHGHAEGSFSFTKGIEGPERIDGWGELSGLRIESSRLGAPFEVAESIRLTTQPSTPVNTSHTKTRLSPQESDAMAQGITVSPFNAREIGTVSGTLSSASYQLAINTDADVPALLRFGQTFGLAVPFSVQQGHAKGDLSIRGGWTGYKHATVAGELTLANIVSGSDAKEIHIDSAHLFLSDNIAQIRDLHASFPSASFSATGSVAVARPCAVALDCNYVADIQIAQFDLAKMQPLFASDTGVFRNLFTRSSWFERNRQTLARLKISGTVRIGHLQGGKVVAYNAATAFRLSDSKLTLSHTAADGFGGSLKSETAVLDLSGVAPSYTVSASLNRLNLGSLLDLFADANITGTLDANVQLQMDGVSVSELSQSAIGTADVQLVNGILGQGQDAFHYRRLMGKLNIADQRITLAKTNATGAAGKPWQASGNVSFARTMNLEFTRGNDHISVIGPVTGKVEARASK